jgi:putative phosphoribosyl transferase
MVSAAGGGHGRSASDGGREGRVFEDRADAARSLSRALLDVPMKDAVALGLPRGGVPIAARVAQELRIPLDVLIVRKLGVPTHPEVAMGAIGESDVRLLDDRMVRTLGISAAEIDAVERRERAVLRARVERLRAGRAPVDLRGRTALVIDDGIATGATASAACRIARARGAARVIVAAPVGSADGVRRIQNADDVVCVRTPRDFGSVGAYYRNFEPTTDDEVFALLSVL